MDKIEELLNSKNCTNITHPINYDNFEENLKNVMKILEQKEQQDFMDYRKFLETLDSNVKKGNLTIISSIESFVLKEKSFCYLYAEKDKAKIISDYIDLLIKKLTLNISPYSFEEGFGFKHNNNKNIFKFKEKFVTDIEQNDKNDYLIDITNHYNF